MTFAILIFFSREKSFPAATLGKLAEQHVREKCYTSCKFGALSSLPKGTI